MPDRSTLTDKLRTAPLFLTLIPMAGGVVLGHYLHISLYAWMTAIAVCAVMAGILVAVRKQLPAIFHTALAVVFFGAAITRLHATEPVVDQGRRVWLEILLTDNPISRQGGRSASTHGVVERWQPDNRHGFSDGQPGLFIADTLPRGKWRASGERLLVNFDTMWHFSVGDRVVFRGYVNPVSDSASSYSRLMRARGYTGRTYISQYSHPAVVESGIATRGSWARRLQSTATERIRRLNDPPHPDRPDVTDRSRHAAIAVAAAMTTGDRSDLTPEVRRTYALAGASHLLAVSGLHVGIVFLIINAILYILPLMRRGHIVKNVVAVVAIWFYATLTGLSPSATRAAFMFTGAQLALATSQNRNPANIMCGTAIVMLTVRPGLLFDISFQLSFVAVAAMLAWFSPFYRLVASSWRVLNALWATLITGFVASVATMPLVSHTFGIFSPAGIVLNPLIVVTAYFIVAFSLVWIAAPLPFLEPLFAWSIVAPARIQNRVVELVGAVPGVAIEWTMPLWLVFVSYVVMTILTVWYHAKPHRQEPLALPR